MVHRASEPFWDLIMEHRPNRDERYLIKRLAEDWGSPSIVVPHARLTASCVAVRTHVLHHQLLIELLHVADAVIVSFFCQFFASQVPKSFFRSRRNVIVATSTVALAACTTPTRGRQVDSHVA